MNYTIEKIAWIDCIFIPMDWTHSVTTRIWIKAWSDYEMDKEWGISHFLEHLAFIWWKRWKTWQELRDFVRDIWWEINAVTWDYRTCYYVNSPCEYWKDQIQILWDMLLDAVYPDSAIESERNVIIEEINRSKDNDARQTYCQWRRFFMWDCSYSRDALWTIENVMWFTKEDFLKYKESLYTKDNIVITVAWKIDEKEELEKLINQTFSKMPEKKARDLPLFKQNFPSKHEMFIEKWINQPCIDIFMNWETCTSELDTSCDILAEIMKRRLFQIIREELWLCYSIKVFNSSQIKYWFFRISTWLKGDKLSFWLEKINEVIDDLLKKWIEKNEFNSIKNSKKWFMLINYETPPKIADFVTDSYITLNKIMFPEDKAKEIWNVTIEDIEKLLPLLKRENRYTFYIK